MLTELGWEVYQEVIGPDGRCDIVGKRGNLLWGIECKVNFGLPVIEQACRWKGRVHYVSIAVKSAPGTFGKNLCSNYGIGIMSYRSEDIHEVVKPKFMRKIKPLKLYEEQKTFCDAGSNCGGHWTNFKRMVRDITNKVNQRPGVGFNELIRSIDHHYASFSVAKACLRGYIGTVIPDIKIEMIDGKPCVFPIKKLSPIKTLNV